ncbi:hypothetical protein LI216_12565 [Mediterraneibacter glycyrrhizinilyticus]|uniref:hypothetical protein n=1 Tax=Mediterraneibacter glycyrrhizinilyticus TaxID=342942 RepID=UPI001D05D9D4|nr:hypothetical protein [Mediterraneibacter glycyrrhizinilyticus]MCB6310396.1 hypothetical protein [Lachnospiraceae bacterium 210521-DFI.1.109]MCB6427896.1 hypothetical protein [Mediterraneibacter glycyrrhizinilyticus]
MRKCNEWTIYEKNEYNLLKELDFKNHSRKGYVYLLEYGNDVKIGTTKQPYFRIVELDRLAKNYSKTCTGSVAISPMHTSRFENEKKLHELFSDKLIGNGELFKTTIKNILDNIPFGYLTWENKEEKFGNAEDIAKIFHGGKHNVSMRKTRSPMFVCFSEEFDLRILELQLFYGIKKEDVLEELKDFIEENVDIKSYEKRYQIETELDNPKTIDICEYFSELSELAIKFLEKLKERQLDF